MPPRYRTIAESLRQALDSGALRPGDRVISARRLAEREGVSLPTAVEALRALEAEGLILARPRSGYFVCGSQTTAPDASRPPQAPQDITMAALARSIFSGSADNIIAPLGAALPDPDWLPVAALQRALNSAARRLGNGSQTYSPPPGRADLRRQIALRAADWGARFGPEDLIITAGETQAMRLALRATCRPGDVVAVESPTYFGVLLLLESLGLKALEIPTDPRDGLDVEFLAQAIARRRPAAVIASPTVQNPLGASLSLEAKRALVALLTRADIPLIEDDVYGDLGPGDPRPSACKAFDEAGIVIHCSSLSKTLAPGWRIGWIAAGRYHAEVLKARLEESLAGPPLLEAALAEFLAGGDYDRHLRRFRPKIQAGVRAVASRAEAQFPQGARISRPTAGFLLWVELPAHIDALEIHRRALAEGISVSPGQLFSPQSSFSHHLRLNCANEPTPRLLRAIDRLGEICAKA
ncbi:MAG: PLP-dependent aminotransferase family protein [Caulobacteraceae bacterium]|nr:PLP-dependent aminotransferase family protein [Caulobacteraceae bacterium]